LAWCCCREGFLTRAGAGPDTGIPIVKSRKEIAMLHIKVLGTGCADCLKMEQIVIEALEAVDVHEARVELVTESRMIEYGLLGDRAPGLLINGQLAWAGSLPTKAQVMEWLQHAIAPAIA
jgi:hypothetical protein